MRSIRCMSASMVDVSADPKPLETGPGTETDADAAALARHAGDLADAIAKALPPFIVAGIRRVGLERRVAITPELEAAGSEAGRRAVEEVMPPLRRLLEADIDDQATTPLEVVRRATPFATAVLYAAGVAEGDRDSFERERFPDDVFGLGPAAFADLGPDVQERAFTWGAAKAHVHLVRRRGRP